MRGRAGKYIMAVFYTLGVGLLLWSSLTFCYQFVAAASSWRQVLDSWGDSRLISALWISILSSFVTVFVSVVLGVPLAFLFAVRRFSGKAFLETLTVDVPQTFPPVAEGIIYFLMLGPQSPIAVNLAYTFTALVIAKVYVSAPFIITHAARQFRAIEQSGVEMTARALGASPFQTLIWIFIPMSAQSIAAGSALCFARAMGELGGSLIFAGIIAYRTEIIPTFITVQASSHTITALAASMIVTAFSAVALLVFKYLTRR